MQLAHPRDARFPRLLLAAILALGFLGVSTQRGVAQDEGPLHTASRLELDIVKVVLTQEKAWNSGDLDGYLKGYKDSPDTIFVGRQISRGYQQIADDYKHNYPNRSAMGTLAFSELEAHPISDTFAICLGHYHLERQRKDGGSGDGIFSLMLEETDDGWKIILDHTS
jgi:ketosteroid isomerase-like protein